MGFDDLFRLSAHAVITDTEGRVLQLKATYDDQRWGLPGGALDPGETVLEALARECMEELGCEIRIQYLSGIYYHSGPNSHAFIFRCSLPDGAVLQLSPEHSELRYFDVGELTPVQRRRVSDCLTFNGMVGAARF